MRTTCSNRTTVLLYRFKEQVLRGMEALQRIAEFVTHVRTAFFLNRSHPVGIVQQRVHRIEIQRPRVDVRVDVVRRSRSVEESLALLPMLAHRTPRRAGILHQFAVILTSFHFREDLLTLVQKRQTGVCHGAVSRNNCVVYVRRNSLLQRRFFVGDYFASLVFACHQTQCTCGK